MKALFYVPALFFSLMFLSACSSSENGEDSSKPAKISNEEVFEKRIADIDNNPDLSMLRSLAYNDNDGNTVEAYAYLNAKSEAVRFEEKYNDAKSGNFGTNTFYVENGKKFATREIYFDSKRKEQAFVERVSYYNQKAKVVFSKVRYAKTEEGLNKSSFNPSTPIDCSEKRVMKVMNQEGEYQTTFQGFVRSNGMVYALVGGPGKTDPVSSVSIQHEYGDISKLLADEVGHIGRKLKVQHDVARSADGLQFQVLIALEIID
jgi:hypothetical protein